MRIEVLVLSGTSPVYDAVLGLGDVTVLTGRNDVGKTRVLRAIESGLMALPDAEWIEVHGIAAPEEIQAFQIDPEMPPTGIVNAVSTAVAPFADAVEMPVDGDGVRVGVLGPPSGELLPAWRYGRALSALDEVTRAKVERSISDEEIDELDVDEPLKLDALGGFDPQILPETIVVPATDGELAVRVVGAIIRLTRALRGLALAWRNVQDVTGPLAGGPAPEWGHHAPIGELAESEPSWEWLVLEDEENPGVSRVHAAAGHACDAFTRIVAGLLPEFISDDYWLRVIPARPTDIARGGCIHIQLQRRDTPPGLTEFPDPYRWFDLSELASGFMVWIQLALCEAAHRAERCIYLLQQHVHAVLLINQQSYEQINGLNLPWEELRDALPLDDTGERDDVIAHRLDGLGIEAHTAALGDLLAWLADPRQALPAIPEQPIFQLPDDDDPFYASDEPGVMLEPLPRGRLYLLDEPEQRLHPALQRRAARWLNTLMSRWGAQCVLATHSVAFMTLSGDTHAYEITRNHDQATILPLDPATLTPYSQLAQEMGLDRGELLFKTRAFLITTRPVAALLQEFHAQRMATSQITLLPVDERDDASEFLSRALLTRVTAAPLAVLLTSITPHEIDHLQLADADQRADVATQESEAGVAALMIDDALRHGHHVEILTLNVHSVFELLDEDAIAGIAAGREPFPGHRKARHRHATTDQTYPEFLAGTYRLTTTDGLMRAIARHMQETAAGVPEALTEVAWRVEQLALTSESAGSTSA